MLLLKGFHSFDFYTYVFNTVGTDFEEGEVRGLIPRFHKCFDAIYSSHVLKSLSFSQALMMLPL